MAVLVTGLLKGDNKPAFVSQVIEVINEYPPQKPVELHPALFPGYMVGCNGPESWKAKLQEVINDIDSRMQVLHNANLIWRRLFKTDEGKKIAYYRRNERRKIVDIPEELMWIPFFEIVPFKDARFPVVP